MSHLRDQLAALSATSPESIVEMLSGLEDRATAIIAASLLENFLGLAIAYKFGRFPSESEFGRLFTGYGPLATLSARIMFAYNLKIINADSRHDFIIIKDIRNQFAHTYLPLTFETGKISANCYNLKLTIKLIPPLSETVHDNARGKYIKSIMGNMSIIISSAPFKTSAS